MSENKRKRRDVKKVKKIGMSKKKIVSILMIVIVLLSTVVSYAFVTQVVIPTQIAQTTPLSILVVGTDNSTSRDLWWDEGDKATLTDSLMVLTFNPEYYRFEVTSIPRDTSVDYVCDEIYERNDIEDPYQDQINEVYYMSGYDISCLEDTISNFLNIPIDYYALLNFDEFEQIVDEIGGVTITAHAADGTLTQDNELATQTYSWTDGETYEMDGDEALTYSRARHDSEADYGRGIRQQQVISAVMTQLLEGDELSISLISDLLGIVETDIPVKLAYEYYKFLALTEQVGAMLIDGTKFTELLLPTSGWEYMFAWFDYEPGGETTVDVVNDFQVYLKENFSDDEISSYFFNQHQLYNEAYSGHYNVVEEQLQTISDALRTNLGLDIEEVSVPSYEYGDNEGNGYIPTEWATGGSDDTYAADAAAYEAAQAALEEESEQEQVVEETEEVEDPSTIDTDGDGVVDSEDFDPNDPDVTVDPDTIDTDGDGTPDVSDDDIDGDGESNSTDPDPYDPNVFTDTDGDGITDDLDDDIDGDGVSNTDDYDPYDPSVTTDPNAVGEVEDSE